jgi:hypothetical protein
MLFYVSEFYSDARESIASVYYLSTMYYVCMCVYIFSMPRATLIWFDSDLFHIIVRVVCARVVCECACLCVDGLGEVEFYFHTLARTLTPTPRTPTHCMQVQECVCMVVHLCVCVRIKSFYVCSSVGVESAIPNMRTKFICVFVMREKQCMYTLDICVYCISILIY